MLQKVCECVFMTYIYTNFKSLCDYSIMSSRRLPSISLAEGPSSSATNSKSLFICSKSDSASPASSSSSSSSTSVERFFFYLHKIMIDAIIVITDVYNKASMHTRIWFKMNKHHHILLKHTNLLHQG